MADTEKKHSACAECREKKLKCVPSEEGGDSCHRCARLGKDCQVPEVKQRKRKARRMAPAFHISGHSADLAVVRGRVEQLESSYSEILSLLKQKPQPNTNVATSVSTSTPSRTDASRLSQVTGLTSPLRFESTDLDASNSYLLEIPLEECEVLLNDYRRMSTNHFPYVMVPEACPVATLVEERPMLAQAVFVATTWRFPERQRALKDKFLQDFSHRYFVKSEKSLDLLQALVVYFAWCHWYATPVATQVYRLGSLVVSLAVELGLNQKPTSVTQHEIIIGPGSALEQGSEAMSSKLWGFEARRAVLGAYTVSTYGLLLFRRPSVLPYSQYLEDCASSLVTDPQYCSDPTLIHMVRSMRVAEETTHTFDHGSKEKIGELSDDKIQILVGALCKQTEEWRVSLPHGTFTTGLLQRAYHSSRCYIHEVGLYGLLHGQAPSVTRLSILYDCFDATMKYLSCVLENGLDDMVDWTSLEWRALNFGIMLSTKSSIILDSAYVSMEASQRAAWLGKCLDTLCLRAHELHRMKGEKCSYFLKLAHEWANIKMYHQNTIQRALPAPTVANTAQQQSQLSVQTQQQNAGMSFMDSAFDVDPFNELFWAGFGDSEPGMAGMYPM
ncbi:hypothetical protein A1O7_02854 [Cladophialophora yegresii CBS 114405]|uniref:Zn(2)-C6 fungal-type domain-containing protein n=1 Tax=Cladophialophora yegresii CBS 114405 TaxID=1182544 RepID=W9WVW7_9EURO|nr:uncharacterized protein A1O7_02854 [Cladophialophora yegresii CBS 114405]EXJ62419.1 hypothetical protein A1O7_02854 [Cladophialophora yegresii CBS 114405]